MAEVKIGEVTHYYSKIGVAVLDLGDAIAIGDVIHVLGHTTDFEQVVRSLQIDHKPVERAEAGQDVALKVAKRVRKGDRVFKVLGVK